MTDDGKKVSFGFSKSIKKSALKIQPPLEQKKVDYIEYVDEESIKIVGYVLYEFNLKIQFSRKVYRQSENNLCMKIWLTINFYCSKEKKVEGPLVIPLLGSKTWLDRILNKTDADIFESKAKNKENGIQTKSVNGDVPVSEAGTELIDVSKIKTEKPADTDDAPKSLEEQAASEILADLHGTEVKVENPNLTVPAVENGALDGTKEVFFNFVQFIEKMLYSTANPNRQS